jgi:hypothetical protein
MFPLQGGSLVLALKIHRILKDILAFTCSQPQPRVDNVSQGLMHIGFRPVQVSQSNILKGFVTQSIVLIMLHYERT